MSFAHPADGFPGPSDYVQHTDHVLQRAALQSPNFPNPNTHRFPVPVSTYYLPRSTAPGTGTGYFIALKPSVHTMDDAPTTIPLPPTPPSKNEPRSLPPPYPSSRPPIPPSRRLSPPPEPPPSSLRRNLPPNAFHLPPVLPQPSAISPLDPRPRYVPTREAPTPPTDVDAPVNVSSSALALLRDRPASGRTPMVRHRRWVPWILGLIIFNGGIVCFAIGITLLALNGLPDSSRTNADINVNIASTTLSVVGFASICCSIVHLAWLLYTRKKARSQQDAAEDHGTRIVIGGTYGSRALTTLKRGGSVRRVFAKLAKAPTFTEEPKSEALKGATELTLVSSGGNHSRERHRRRRDEAPRRLSPIESLDDSRPPDSIYGREVIEQVQKQGKFKVVQQTSSEQDHASSERTSFLDLGDDRDDDNIVTLPTKAKWAHERISTQNREAIPQSIDDYPNTRRQKRQQQQPNIPEPLHPARKTRRPVQRANGESLRPSRLFNSWLPNSVEESFDQDQENERRMQDIARYTSSLKRLRQDGLLKDQRFSSTNPAQGQAVHIPKLAIRARNDIAKALGPAIERRVAAQVENSKGKQKEMEAVIEDDGDGDVDRALQYTHSHSASDSDLRELASLAARSSGLPSISSIAPIDSPPFNRQRPAAHGRSLSDSQALESSRTTMSSLASLTERGPGDLILRMRNAHKRSESATQIPYARGVLAGEGVEFTLAPLLPATVYTPNVARAGANNLAQPPTRPVAPLRIDEGPGLTRADYDLHVRDIAQREIVPSIQSRNVSHQATENTLPHPPSPQVATISTSYPPSPSSDPLPSPPLPTGANDLTAAPIQTHSQAETLVPRESNKHEET